MMQPREVKEMLPPTVRAELLLSGAGERLGAWAGAWAERMRHPRHVLHDKESSTNPPEESPRAGTQQPRKVQSVERSQRATERVEATPSATVRAEAMVGQMGERMAHWTRDSNLQIRRAMAFLREGSEDMWEEAQELRHQWEHSPR